MTASLASACRSDLAVEPNGPQVSVCHLEGSAAVVENVFLSELADHKSHGDYVARLEVSKANAPGDSIHFTRVTDALAVARAGRFARNEAGRAACRITIAVGPGTLSGSTAPSSDPAFERFPLVIDVPDITLKGALKMQVDAGGRATGVAEGGDATTFSPSPALIVAGASAQVAVSEPIIVVNGHPNGSVGNGAVIEGFVFQSGRAPTATPVGGQGIFTMRVSGLVVRGNRFEGGFTEPVDLRVSTGVVERNLIAGTSFGCDICLAGPGDYVVRDNRLPGPGGLPGIFAIAIAILPVHEAVEQYTLPASALVTATIANNEVIGHLNKQVGTGIRVGAIGLGAQNVPTTSKVTLTGNSLVGNTFGIIVDASFPVAGNTLKGDIEVTTSGNTITGSCQNDLYVALTRHQNGLGFSTPFTAFLKNSTYTLTLGSDIAWSKAWFVNPSGYGNALIVNGQTMPNGTQTAYDGAKVCS